MNSFDVNADGVVVENKQHYDPRNTYRVTLADGRKCLIRSTDANVARNLCAKLNHSPWVSCELVPGGVRI